MLSITPIFSAKKTSGGVVNQRQLAKDMASRSGLPTSTVMQGIKALPQLISGALQSDSDVRIVNFGTFETIKYPSRTVRNPREPGKKFVMLAHGVPKFHPSGSFKSRLRSKVQEPPAV